MDLPILEMPRAGGKMLESAEMVGDEENHR